jgi:hypothetical protein
MIVEVKRRVRKTRLFRSHEQAEVVAAIWGDEQGWDD